MIKITINDSLLPIDNISKILNRGDPILIFDDSSREGETDIFFSAKHVNSVNVKFLRKEGGGMVFLASSHLASEKLGLPFAQDMYHSLIQDSKGFDLIDIMLSHTLPYDTRSSFSLFINHKDTFTGITDDDRSLTARLFAELVDESTNLSEEEARFRLASSFRIPGHVPVCIADKDILKGRQGHTELIVALMKYARLTPVALGCEMLSDNGKALPPEEARFWAEERGYLFLEGRQIVEECQ